MYRWISFFLSLVVGTYVFAQKPDDIFLLLSKGKHLDAFQLILQRDVNYTNYILMTNAARIVLSWGKSTNGETFLLRNNDNEERGYYFPVPAVLASFTNQYAKDASLWELISLYYTRGLWEEWFSPPESAAKRLVEVSAIYQKTARTPRAEILAGRAFALRLIGETQEAWNLITNLFVLYPKEYRIIYLYAEMLRERDKPQEALSLIQQHYPYFKDEEQRSSFELLSAKLYLSAERPKEAVFLLEQMLLTSTNKEGLLLLLHACRQLNDWQRFTKRALLLVEVSKGDGTILSEISRLFILSGQITWAEIFFDQASENYGTTPMVRGSLAFYLGEVYRNTRHFQKALQMYEQAKHEFLQMELLPSENIALIDMMIYRVKNP